MLRTAFAALAALLLASAVQAQPLDGRLKRIAETKTIAIAHRTDAMPFSFTENGQVTGFTVDLCKRVVTSIERQINVPGLQIKWVPVTSQNRFDVVASGQADLAIGVGTNLPSVAGLRAEPLGDLRFVFALAPHHPLARQPEPLADALLREHRLIAVADSARRSSQTLGILAGQDVFTVDNMRAKIQAQLRGLGGGFLPEPMVRPYMEAGRLVVREVARPARTVRLNYMWAAPATGTPGRALQWWLAQLQGEATRRALLENHALI